jgi:putative oxidoreductase
MNLIETVRARALEELARLSWLAPLLGRLALGLLFMLDGWAKAHNLAGVTDVFKELGIPAPALNAAVVAYSQLICGALLVVGLFTRLATIPIVVSMAIALLTAKRDKIHGLYDLVGQDELTYLVMLLMIALIGPGIASLDHLLVQRLGWKGASKAT